MRVLALLTVLVSAADHWTTYLCLRAPVAGWNVTEANLSRAEILCIKQNR